MRGNSLSYPLQKGGSQPVCQVRQVRRQLVSSLGSLPIAQSPVLFVCCGTIYHKNLLHLAFCHSKNLIWMGCSLPHINGFSY